MNDLISFLECVVSFEEDSELVEFLRERLVWYGACFFNQVDGVVVGVLCFAEERELFLFVDCAE